MRNLLTKFYICEKNSKSLSLEKMILYHHKKKSMIKKCANNVDNSFLLRKLFFTQYYLEQ